MCCPKSGSLCVVSTKLWLPVSSACISLPVCLLSSDCLLAFKTHPLSVLICATSPLLPKSHCRACPPWLFLPFIPSSAFRFQLFSWGSFSWLPHWAGPPMKSSSITMCLFFMFFHTWLFTFIQVWDHAGLSHVYHMSMQTGRGFF